MSGDQRKEMNVAVLGATGSIGTSTMDVLSNLNQVDPDCRWNLYAASAHKNLTAMQTMLSNFSSAPERIVLSDPATAPNFASTPGCNVGVGPDQLIDVARDPNVDILVAAIVGRAGLESTLAAIETGKRVALANKETMVVAGPLVDQLAKQGGAEILPIDSEHSAIFQCIGTSEAAPKRIILTASGGPFRCWTTDQMKAATPTDALAHPTWDMGKKISIDSATMMNKSLEIIEARWLFGLPADAIEVVVHPQSIIHSMVEFDDGSVVAQLSPPDMRLPIQYAMTYPRRLPCPAPELDRSATWNLTLEPADRERFPALDLGFEVAQQGGTCGAVVNAANEEAVDLFLNGQIRFTEIVPACRSVLANHDYEPTPSLERLLELDCWARTEVKSALNRV